MTHEKNSSLKLQIILTALFSLLLQLSSVKAVEDDMFEQRALLE